MNQRLNLLGCLGVFVALACSSGANATVTGPRARTAARGVPVTPVQTPARAHALATNPAPLEPRTESERDRVFIENAERAIGLYTEFLARAGDREEYAQAAKRSREQIEDLRRAIDFVRAGEAERALH
ncbi:MAG TPA: hypothetical protein VFK05_14085 [Polyangiaceae bacterium]|nr:hypothetical protein [Polyangiaceae bacterium]